MVKNRAPVNVSRHILYMVLASYFSPTDTRMVGNIMPTAYTLQEIFWYPYISWPGTKYMTTGLVSEHASHCATTDSIHHSGYFKI